MMKKTRPKKMPAVLLAAEMALQSAVVRGCPETRLDELRQARDALLKETE